MGKIQLVGIEVMARIGLLEEEQYAPQDLLVSLDLTYDFESIKISDEITEGIDYRDLICGILPLPMMVKPWSDLPTYWPLKLKKSFPCKKLFFLSINPVTLKN
jgi:hypothetical protein